MELLTLPLTYKMVVSHKARMFVHYSIVQNSETLGATLDGFHHSIVQNSEKSKCQTIIWISCHIHIMKLKLMFWEII